MYTGSYTHVCRYIYIYKFLPTSLREVLMSRSIIGHVRDIVRMYIHIHIYTYT